ncbi:MAG: hypothetical protein JWO08_3868, partial [Verrucomicrobiaceae bacterium]|nr:hypothetical protein [Verrucomicrobiaceae bacterium]
MKPGLEVPILLLGYNRPDLMTGLINVLRGLRPLCVYVSLDGPRAHKAGDHERCQATRDVIANQIDWPCQLH